MTKILRSLGFAVMLATLAPVAGCLTETETGDEQDVTAAAGVFELFVGADGQHYFQLLAGNKERVLRSEGYTTLANAKKGIASVRKNGVSEANFEVLDAVNGESYVNLHSRDNGQIIGTTETYASRSNATRAVKSIVALLKSPTEAAAPAGNARFETFVGQDAKHYFRLRAGNGEVVLQSQAYTTKASAENGIASVKTNGVISDRYDVLQAEGDQHYFRVVAGNNKVIARGETYASRSNALRGVDTVQRIVREITGAAAPSDAQVKTSIETAAQGAIFVSESDFALTYVSAPLAATDGITEALVREKLASFVDNDEAADKPLRDLVGMSGTFEEWQADYLSCGEDSFPGPAECAEMRELNAALEANLTGIQVFYFGRSGEPGNVEGVAVTIFIVGRTPSGNLAGVRTIAIWT
jgi:uncharacterized protein